MRPKVDNIYTVGVRPLHPLSQCLAFQNSLSKFLYLLVHIVGDRFLSSPMKSTPTSACSTSAWTQVLALVLDPCLSSGNLDFDFDFMVVVTATAIVENHLLVLVVRVGVSVRVRLRSVVRWQDAGASTIMWVSRQIRNPSPSSLSHLTLSLSGLSLLYFFWIFDKFEKG